MAQVTSPYTIEIEEGCCVGSDCIPVVLTLKTALPITRRALRAVRKGICGKPIQCSNQAGCPENSKKGCLLNIKDYCWTTEGSVTVTFSKMTPENLEALIKADGYKIVNRNGFLRSLRYLGLSWTVIWQVLDPYLPKRSKTRESLLRKRPKKLLETPVKEHFLERFIKANGYDVVRHKGSSAAARASGLTRSMVRKIIIQHPPKEPIITKWQQTRQEGKLEPVKWWMQQIRPQQIKRFLNANGYEVAQTESVNAAIRTSGLCSFTVQKILRQLPTKESALDWLTAKSQMEGKRKPLGWLLKPINARTIEKFIEANGYEIAEEKGVVAAACASGVCKGTVSRILTQFPTKESYA